MVLKKLGDELMEEYLEVLRYLGTELRVAVVVEPHDYEQLVRGGVVGVGRRMYLGVVRCGVVWCGVVCVCMCVWFVYCG
jgi:hypothetical protein